MTRAWRICLENVTKSSKSHPPLYDVVVGLIYREELKRFREVVSNRLEEDRVC